MKNKPITKESKRLLAERKQCLERYLSSDEVLTITGTADRYCGRTFAVCLKDCTINGEHLHHVWIRGCKGCFFQFESKYRLQTTVTTYTKQGTVESLALRLRKGTNVVNLTPTKKKVNS